MKLELGWVYVFRLEIVFLVCFVMYRVNGIICDYYNGGSIFINLYY